MHFSLAKKILFCFSIRTNKGKLMNVQKITLSPIPVVHNNGENKKLNSNPITEVDQSSLVGLESLSAYNKARFLSPVSFGEADIVEEDDSTNAINYDQITPVTESGTKSEKLQNALYNGLFNLDPDKTLVLTNSDFVATATRFSDLIEGQLLDPDSDNLLLIVDERIQSPIFFQFRGMNAYNMIIPEKSLVTSFLNNGLDICSDYDHVVPVFNNDVLKINNAIDPVRIYDQSFLDKNYDTLVIGNHEFVLSVNTDKFLDDQDVDFLGIDKAKNAILSTEATNSVNGLKDLKPLFKDVGGQKDVITKIEEEIVFPLIYPNAFGHIMNKGAILCGPPGTGKTYIARALANEIALRLGQKVTFMNIDGNVLNKSEVGLTEENWRTKFAEAKESQPCIMFIDEGDSFTQSRDSSRMARYDNKTVNQILTLMSELEASDDKVFVIMATNRLEMMDSAITRDGRFGVIINVDLPDKDGCREIFDIHIKSRNPDENLDRDTIARTLASKKVSGASIAGIVERAFKNSYRRCGIYDKMREGTFTYDDLKDVKITMEDVQKAIQEADKGEKLKSGKSNFRPIGFNVNKE